MAWGLCLSSTFLQCQNAEMVVYFRYNSNIINVEADTSTVYLLNKGIFHRHLWLLHDGARNLINFQGCSFNHGKEPSMPPAHERESAQLRCTASSIVNSIYVSCSIIYLSVFPIAKHVTSKTFCKLERRSWFDLSTWFSEFAVSATHLKTGLLWFDVSVAYSPQMMLRTWMSKNGKAQDNSNPLQADHLKFQTS